MHHQPKPFTQQVREQLQPIAENVGAQLKALIQADAPNYAMSASASIVFGTIACLEDGFTRALLFTCSFGSAILATNQYNAAHGFMNSCKKTLKNVMPFFKKPENPIKTDVEQPQLRTRKTN